DGPQLTAERVAELDPFCSESSTQEFVVRKNGDELAVTPEFAMMNLTVPPIGRRRRLSLQFLDIAWNRLAIVGEQPWAISGHGFRRCDSQDESNPSDYEVVRVHEIYHGIDLYFYPRVGTFQFDLIVQPGTDTHQISIEPVHAGRPKIDPSGNLILHAGYSNVVERVVIYHQWDEMKEFIEGGFELRNQGSDVG